MALFRHLSNREICDRFTHVVLWMLVPVYIKLVEDEDGDYVIPFGMDGNLLPEMQEMNWVPSPLFWIASAIAGAYLFFTAAAFKQPNIPIIGIAEIRRGG